MPAEVVYRGSADCKHAEGRLDDRKPAGVGLLRVRLIGTLPGFGFLPGWKRRAVRPLGFFGHPLWLGLTGQLGYVADVSVSIWHPESLVFVSLCANWKAATEEAPGIWMQLRGGVANPHPNFRQALKCNQ